MPGGYPLSPYPGYQSAGGSILAGAGPYREAAFVASQDDPWACWGEYANRKLRYAMFSAHVEGSAYRKIQSFASGLKDSHDLYDYVRPILSPAYRCVEFWSQHLMGGLLDPDAGDGKAVPSCIPIVAEDEAIRGVIARIWRESNWQTYKDVWTLNGASMGDAPLLIVDDPYRRAVYFKVIHPGTVRDVTKDDYGNVKGYTIEEIRVHPEADRLAGRPETAIYREVCEKVGERITYTTYLDGGEYDWRSYDEGTPDGRRHGPTWTEDYGFVPMVMVQHRNRGLGWGWSELQPSLAKLHELDDMASKLDDGVRSATRPKWFLAGVSPSEPLDFTGDDDEDEGAIERNTEDSIKASNPQARPYPMVADLDIAAASAHVAGILAAIERDHPELSADLAGMNASGKARRVAQERLEAVVVQRRVGYADALVRAQKMGASIGAIKGYPGFEGFSAESYANGDLEHSIGDCPVFSVDEMDRIEERKARADVFKVLVDGGMGMADAAEEAGYSPERVTKLRTDEAKAEKLAREAEREAKLAATRTAVAMPGAVAKANENGAMA